MPEKRQSSCLIFGAVLATRGRAMRHSRRAPQVALRSNNTFYPSASFTKRRVESFGWTSAAEWWRMSRLLRRKMSQTQLAEAEREASHVA